MEEGASRGWKLKLCLVGIRGHVRPFDELDEVIGPIRVEYFEKFEEATTREKAIQVEIRT